MGLTDITSFPEQIRLENTNACNARCVICPREKLTRKIGFMEEGLLDRILAESAGRRVTRFTLQGFGEPLLDKLFCARVRRIKEALSCPTYTVSNGSLITPDLARDIVTSGLDKMKISFYGTSAAEYEAVHVPMKYADTVRGIMNLVRAKRDARSELVIQVQYIGRLWKFLPFSLQWLGKARPGFSTLHNYTSGRDYRKAKGRRRPCPILSASILQVLWTGDVVPCCYDFDGRMVLGNLFTDTIDSIWHGERYAALRRAHAAWDFEAYPLCRSCDKCF